MEKGYEASKKLKKYYYMASKSFSGAHYFILLSPISLGRFTQAVTTGNGIFLGIRYLDVHFSSYKVTKCKRDQKSSGRLQQIFACFVRYRESVTHYRERVSTLGRSKGQT